MRIKKFDEIDIINENKVIDAKELQKMEDYLESFGYSVIKTEELDRLEELEQNYPG